MEKLKTFEKFNKMNELTGALIDRSRKSAFLKRNDLYNENDPIAANLKNQQGFKFDTYINPELVKYAESYGIKLYKSYLHTLITIPIEDGKFIYIRVRPDGSYFFNGT